MAPAKGASGCEWREVRGECYGGQRVQQHTSRNRASSSIPIVVPSILSAALPKVYYCSSWCRNDGFFLVQFMCGRAGAIEV